MKKKLDSLLKNIFLVSKINLKKYLSFAFGSYVLSLFLILFHVLSKIKFLIHFYILFDKIYRMINFAIYQLPDTKVRSVLNWRETLQLPFKFAIAWLLLRLFWLDSVDCILCMSSVETKSLQLYRWPTIIISQTWFITIV